MDEGDKSPNVEGQTGNTQQSSGEGTLGGPASGSAESYDTAFPALLTSQSAMMDTDDSRAAIKTDSGDGLEDSEEMVESATYSLNADPQSSSTAPAEGATEETIHPEDTDIHAQSGGQPSALLYFQALQPAHSTAAAPPIELRSHSTASAPNPHHAHKSRPGLTSGASSKPGGILPSLAPSQAEIGRIPSAGRDRRGVKTAKPSTYSTRVRNVPNVVRMATVTGASARERPETPVEYYQSGHYGESPGRRFHKTISWEQANSARPPLRIDMDGPNPCSYSPIVKPLSETNAPAWSFGRRSFVEKKGGARKSWEKSWFHTDDVWKMKTDFITEVVWPTPTHYNQRPTLGPQQSTKLNYPSYSCGVRRSISIGKKGSRREPAPNDYDKHRADKLMYRRAPAYSHSTRNGGTCLWAQGRDVTPGPGAYESDASFVQKHEPSFSIVGIRREKTHELGPFATF